MEESILTSVKKVLGIGEEYTHFDADIVMHVNTALNVVTQLGVGPAAGFAIQDATAVWGALTGDALILNAVKTYVSLKVRVMFDPPTVSAVLESMNRLLGELEWRITVAAETFV